MKRVRRSTLLKSAILGLCTAGLLAGCATVPPKSNKAAYQAYQQQNDPLKPTNKVMYHLDNTLDTYIFKPVAQGYTHVTTQGMRNHVSDFMTNLDEPGHILYFMAAGKPRDAGTALVRFLVNSTIGIGGIFDPAGAMGYHPTPGDLGLVLASYGVGEGPYLYLPFFGPSDLRDSTTVPANIIISPTFPAPSSTGLTIFTASSTALNAVNTRAGLLGEISNIKQTALDPYATFRSLYRQHRAAQLRQMDKDDVITPPAWYPAKVRAKMKGRHYGGPPPKPSSKNGHGAAGKGLGKMGAGGGAGASGTGL